MPSLAQKYDKQLLKTKVFFFLNTGHGESPDMHSMAVSRVVMRKDNSTASGAAESRVVMREVNSAASGAAESRVVMREVNSTASGAATPN